ncbi:NAD-dependent protein deacetylase of SIR2 family, partial [uncultured Rubrobacteraceae bacterium]
VDAARRRPAGTPVAGVTGTGHAQRIPPVSRRAPAPRQASVPHHPEHGQPPPPFRHTSRDPGGAARQRTAPALHGLRTEVHPARGGMGHGPVGPRLPYPEAHTRPAGLRRLRRPARLFGGELRRFPAARGAGPRRVSRPPVRPDDGVGLFANGAAGGLARAGGAQVRKPGSPDQPGQDPLRQDGNAASVGRYRRGLPTGSRASKARARKAAERVL